MIDEVDVIQSDSTYRPALGNAIDWYLRFPKENRCLVAATYRNFSHPVLKRECKTTIFYPITGIIVPVYSRETTVIPSLSPCILAVPVSMVLRGTVIFPTCIGSKSRKQTFCPSITFWSLCMQAEERICDKQEARLNNRGAVDKANVGKYSIGWVHINYR